MTVLLGICFVLVSTTEPKIPTIKTIYQNSKDRVPTHPTKQGRKNGFNIRGKVVVERHFPISKVRGVPWPHAPLQLCYLRTNHTIYRGYAGF